MSVECIIKNAASTVGEGPHWDDASNTLLYVDIFSKEIHRFDPETKKDDKITLDETVSFVVPARKGGLIVGLGLSIAHVDWDTKKVKRLQSVEPGTRSRFNDGKCDPKGRIFAGTMGPVEPDEARMPMIGSLYRLDLDGTLHKCVTDIGISNGLGWSEDAKTMYFIDSTPNHVYSYNYDVNTGQMSNRRILVDNSGKEHTEYGFPDGMTVDTDGKLWVASFGAAKLIRYDPETGNPLQSIEFPARRITSCCFGGKNLDELYVTCAAYGAPKEELEAYPLSGSVFRVTGLGVKGYPANIYEGEI